MQGSEECQATPEADHHAAVIASANAYAQSLGLRPTPPVLETSEQRAAWAIDIADDLVSILHREAETDPEHSLVIDECWIGAEDLALYIRYGGRTGCRVADLHLDVTQGGPPGTARGQASDIYHDLYGSGPSEYVDRDGFEWFRDEPADGDWSRAVQEQARMHTAWPPPANAATLAYDVAATLTARGAEELAAHPHDPALEDCWVGEDLALYVRYRYGGEPRGHRAAHLDRERLRPEFGLNARNLARQIWLELGAATDPAYVDREGYRWGGDEPQAPVTWEYVIERMPRADAAD